MPVSRFSRLRQSQQLEEAYTNYKTWQDRPYNPQVNSRGASGLTNTVYCHPYDITYDALKTYRAKSTEDASTALNTHVNGAAGAETEETTTKEVTLLPGYSAARVIWFRNASRTVTVTPSKITGTSYLKYTGTRDSYPFGASAVADKEFSAFEAIKLILLAQPSLAVNRVSLKRERISAR